MSVRYIYNTSGNYVAFISGDKLFSPDAEWLGMIRNGNMVYLKNGKFVGYLLKDDRIARKKGELPKMNIIPPLAPLKPLKPLRPLKRLPMSPLLYPYEDVFEAGLIPTREKTASRSVKDFSELLDAKIVAADGTFLGKISKNQYDSESISNPYGNYGSRYSSQSILNPYGNYGSEYGSQSPLNPYSSAPPRIVKDSVIIAYLTVNPYINGNRIDPKEFFTWLEIK